MNLFKKLIPDIVAVVLFAVISFAYFFPAVTEGRILAQHDAVAGIGSGQEQKEYLEKTGERTRWTNSIFGGMPTYQMSPSYDSTEALGFIQGFLILFLHYHCGGTYMEVCHSGLYPAYNSRYGACLSWKISRRRACYSIVCRSADYG